MMIDHVVFNFVPKISKLYALYVVLMLNNNIGDILKLYTIRKSLACKAWLKVSNVNVRCVSRLRLSLLSLSRIDFLWKLDFFNNLS